MKKLILSLVLLFAASTLLVAQGTIKGNVKAVMRSGGTDSTFSLPGIEVYVMSGSSRINTYTNALGDFTLKPLEPGSYNVVINNINIDTMILVDIRVTGNSIAFMKDVTVPFGRTYKTVVIRPDAPLKDENPSKEKLKPDQIKQIADKTNLNTLIAAMTAGVYVSEDGKQISFKGARLGDVLYIVDDVRMRGSEMSVPSGSIASLNSYNGGAPARYGDFMGGVVVVETMSYFDWENQQIVRELIAAKEKEAAMEQEAFRESLKNKEEQK
ncbi:MAG TPA: carboxypeptidase-like regulatory domain-containing protein [Bacteroidales bacterium]|nr:carboxypeptidase-like regulatory domain-containing protein [Bacteroidales bacterium]HRZ48456.1 carboxypeptidase-like regulatory domain-containing protein [Bacteroidales bacterium]